jgi:hypothetical protein
MFRSPRSSGLSDHPLVGSLKAAIRDLPPRYRPRMEALAEQLGHWVHLREDALRRADDLITDIRLENAWLRLDFEAIRREYDLDLPPRGTEDAGDSGEGTV